MEFDRAEGGVKNRLAYRLERTICKSGDRDKEWGCDFAANCLVSVGGSARLASLSCMNAVEKTDDACVAVIASRRQLDTSPTARLLTSHR